MVKFKYDKQKDLIVKLFNNGKNYTEIAKILSSDNINRDTQNVRRLVIHYLNPSESNRKIVLTEEIKSRILKYLSDGKNPTEISNELNICKPTISSFIRESGIRLNPDKGNVHYFDVIDSYAKAYIIGFIAADGSIVKSKTTTSLTITVKYEDKAILEFIRSEIGSTHKFLEITRPSSYNKDKLVHHIRYCIADRNITSALNNLGILPNKSLTIGNVIENIPYKYRDAFIIGYFDGNGSASIIDGLHINNKGKPCMNYLVYVQIRGTRELLTGICEHLGVTINHIHKFDSIPSLSFANKKDVYRFFQCYNNLPFYYERKYDKFLKRINHKSYDKYRQVQTISSPAIK